MVDEERVARLLSRITDDSERLRDLRNRDLADRTTLDAVKYRFITSVEGMVAVAHHVVVSEGWTVPETNADAVRELGRRGVIDEALSESLARSVGFRNVLVHGYAIVDDSVVLGSLDRLDEIDSFVSSVARWLMGG